MDFPASHVWVAISIVKVPEQVGAAKIRIAKVPRFPGRGSQARFPRPVPKPSSQARFPKVPRKRFPSKVSKNRFPKVPTKRFPSKVLKSRFPSKVPRQGSQEQVPKSRFASKVTKQGFPSRAPRNRFASKVSRHRCPNKVFVVPDRWSIKGLSRFIWNSSQTSFRQTCVDFFM